MLTEFQPIKLSLEESEDGRTIAKGRFALADEPTRNKRVYPKNLWVRELGRLGESVERRRAYGELDHPGDGKTKLARVSHVITSLQLREDGEVYGEAEILDTPNGKTLKALLKAGCEVGVSSRGFGSTKPRGDGNEEVLEDFVLKTFDFVADPSVKTAYPEIFNEDVEFTAAMLSEEFGDLLDEATEMRAKTLADAKVGELTAGLRDALKAELHEEFERKLAGALVGVREDALREVREDVAADPEMGGAKAVLARIAELVLPFKEDTDEAALRDLVKAKELDNAALRDKLESATQLAKEATYRLFIEQEIAGHPMAKTIRSLMRDAGKGSQTMEDVKGKLAAIQADLAAFMPKEEDAGRDGSPAHARVEELERERDRLVSENDKLKGKLIRASEIAEKLAEQTQALEKERDALRTAHGEAKRSADAEKLRAQKSEAVRGYANSPQLKEMLEDVDDEEGIDRVIERHGTHNMADPALQAMREKLQKGRPGVAPLTEDNESGSPLRTIMGQDVREIQTLAGIAR